ncbi:MbcA/ParS/Xre antitoxin family protein [bacterium]|nr:MbcA/ParS/Xre antitoxin family protein [bacterium]
MMKKNMSANRGTASRQSRLHVRGHEGSGKFHVMQKAELDFIEEVARKKTKVADLLQVDRSRITKWQKGEFPDAENVQKIAALAHLFTLLISYYYEDVALSWLKGTNAHLGNKRPIDLIRKGQIDDVILAAKQTIAGSYA